VERLDYYCFRKHNPILASNNGPHHIPPLRDNVGRFGVVQTKESTHGNERNRAHVYMNDTNGQKTNGKKVTP